MPRCENLLGSAYLKLTQAASHRFKKFNLFLYKEQIYRFYSLRPAIFHNYSESSLNQSDLLLTTKTTASVLLVHMAT